MLEKFFNSNIDIEKYNTIAFYEKKDEQGKVKDKVIIYSICAVSSLVLSLFNLFDGYIAMLWATLSLSAGLIISIVLEKYFKLFLIGDIVAAVFVGVTFSAFALYGSNNGFAILWFLVLPIVMVNVSKKVGMGLSIYSLIFVFVVCYTPLRNLLPEGVYTQTFLERFPLLCATNFIVVFYTYSKTVIAERELAIKTYVDELTGLYNRQFYRVVCNYLDENNITNKCTIVSLDVNGLKIANDQLGHIAGDDLIRVTSKVIEEAFSINNLGIFRIGGDEFIVILKCDRSDIPTFERRLDEAQKKYSEQSKKNVSLSYGFASGMDYPKYNFESLYKVADEMMIANKTKYYVTNKIDRRHSDRRDLEHQDRRISDLINADMQDK